MKIILSWGNDITFIVNPDIVNLFLNDNELNLLVVKGFKEIYAYIDNDNIDKKYPLYNEVKKNLNIAFETDAIFEIEVLRYEIKEVITHV